MSAQETSPSLATHLQGRTIQAEIVPISVTPGEDFADPEKRAKALKKIDVIRKRVRSIAGKQIYYMT